ncbi:ROK family transcriptional regulator [Cellulomonas denverensis]|uniref:ROK family transcriptional regulator n=1 Tax=Cellulomonas denverensis TaxID=264297 RepID=A0A7X6KVL9_9CELL|nr:ROK family transcriptional regulator [Cellulomonas denverensis]NKY23099.1 ROK family transcriptional regulator [Cellulomonas denverensis]GIG23820.1 NagC family transcriptional regulator [Cellulomonas denverensis]
MAGSQTALREANRATVVETIRRYGGLTQVELAAATGLSAATVSNIVRELQAAGDVDVKATVYNGRRAALVTMVHRTGIAAGIHIGIRHMAISLADTAQQTLVEQSLPLPHEHRADTSLDRAALLVVELLERVGSSLDELLGIGIGVPAPVDAATGTVSVPGILRGWDDAPVAQVMSKRLGVPVFVDNDANLGALAESRLGAARQYQDSVYVRVSHGTGAGVSLAGRLHRGFAGTAGEIGHVQVDAGGVVCLCGSRGCLNTVAGAPALIDVLRASRGALTLRDIVALANDGDPGCRQVVEDAGATIGAVVAGLAIAVNPQCVVVGGELAETGELLIAPMREAIRRRVPLNHLAPLEVVAAELGSRAEVTGAVLLALENTRATTRWNTRPDGD